MSQLSPTRMRLMLLALVLAAGSALANPVISISPLNSTQTVNSSFAVVIDVSGAVDVYAYQFDLQFDPSLLKAISSKEGSFLMGAGSTVFYPGIIDNDAGLFSFISNALTGPVLGANGGGALAEIIFSATASGVSSLTLSNVLLLDSSLNIIASVEVVSGQVSLIPSTLPVPEPASGLLVGLGLLAMSLRRRDVGNSAAGAARGVNSASMAGLVARSNVAPIRIPWLATSRAIRIKNGCRQL